MSEKSQNTLNIQAHFEAAVAAAEAKLKAANASLKDAEKEVVAHDKEHKAALKAIYEDIEKTNKLIDSLAGADEEFDSRLKKKAADLISKRDSLVAGHSSSPKSVSLKEAIADAQQSIESAQKKLDKSNGRLEIAISIARAHQAASGARKDKVGAVDAKVYETLSEAVAAYLDNVPLVVEVSADDARLDKVHVRHNIAGGCSAFDLFAGKGLRFMMNRVPNDLAWLREVKGAGFSSIPESGHGSVPDGVGADEDNKVLFADAATDGDLEYWERAGHGSRILEATRGKCEFGQGSVFYVKNEGKFYAANVKKFPSLKVIKEATEVVGGIQGKYVIPAKTEEIALDASSVFLEIGDAVMEHVSGLAEDFSALPTAKSSIAQRVLSAVSKVASTKPMFEPQEKRLSQQEVEALVGAYWNAFLSAPWESHVDGNVAMLKHLCSRGLETPHVWSNSVKGHYGLRVRTRDHTWILADIFCPIESLSPSEAIPPEEVTYLEHSYQQKARVVKVGPCYIAVWKG